MRIKPRDYQIEAARWALSRSGATIVMPTGSGKTLIGVIWALELLKKGVVKKVLFLEPTRILVEQTARYINKVSGFREAVAIHGEKPKKLREELWVKARIAVSTPETALSDYKMIIKNKFDAVVVDECHHTTGKDAYAEFMRRVSFKRRLGLTAYIPRSRYREIEDFIGEVREWSWSDERIRKYVPDWIGEIYEAELNNAEREVLEELEDARLEYTGRERGLVSTAIRWFVRDGALALKESLERETSLATILGHIKPLLEKPEVRELHKLEALNRILRDHEGFMKAIVFVERVVVARKLESKLKSYNAVALYGKSKMRESVKAVLEKARSSRTKVIVSTSAGEEGVDLPEADLLVIWSNVASPLRFIQRHGRILRLAGRGGVKFVAYIVTPETPDMDSLLDSLEEARKAGVDVPVSSDVIESLWRRTERSRILRIISGRPMPIEWICEAAGAPRDIVEKAIRRLESKGMVIYIYTHHGKTYAQASDVELLEKEYREYLEPNEKLVAKVKPLLPGGESRFITGVYSVVLKKMLKTLARRGALHGVTASIQVPLPTGALQQVNLHYTFTITSSRVLEVVLRNIYSVEKYLRFITSFRREEVY